jgi:hypothetical protein
MGFFVKILPMPIFIIPIMTALLAWFIAWLFVQLIFSGKGKYLRKQIASIQIETFINQETANAQFEAVLPMIDQQLDHFFTHKIGEKLPMVSMFIGEKTIVQLKAVFIEELDTIFPSLVSSMSNAAIQGFLNNLEHKWNPILAAKFLKSTRKFRIISFFIGLVWGFLMYFLAYHL